MWSRLSDSNLPVVVCWAHDETKVQVNWGDQKRWHAVQNSKIWWDGREWTVGTSRCYPLPAAPILR